MKIVSWNMARVNASWDLLIDTQDQFDFAMLQEARVPKGYESRLPAHWQVPERIIGLKPTQYGTEILSLNSRYRRICIDRDVLTASAVEGEPLLYPRWRDAAIVRVRRRPRSYVGLLCYVSGESQAGALPNTVRALRRAISGYGHDSLMPLIVCGDMTSDINRTPWVFRDLEEMGLIRVGPPGPNYRNKPSGQSAAQAWNGINHVFVSQELVRRVRVIEYNHACDDCEWRWGPSDQSRIGVSLDESEAEFGGGYPRWRCRWCAVDVSDLDVDDPTAHGRAIARHLNDEHAARYRRGISPDPRPEDYDPDWRRATCR